MNRLNSILIGALVVQVLLAVVLRMSGGTDSIGTLEPVIDLDPETVTRIEILGPLETGSETEQEKIVLVKDGSQWVLDNHHNYPVRSQQIDTFLNKVAGAKSRGPIATSAPRHKQLEVADDRYERRVTIAHGEGESVFYLGAPAGGRKTALRVAGSDQVHGVPELTPSAAALQINLWAAATYFSPAGEITSIGVDNAQGSFVLEKTGDTFNVLVNGADLVPPQGKQLDSSKLNQLFARFKSLRMKEPAPTEGAPTQGQITLTIKTDGGDVHYLDAAVDKDDLYHVRERENPNAVRVAKSALEDLFELSADKLVMDAPDPGDDAGDNSAPAPTPPPGPTPMPAPTAPGAP